MPPKPKPVKERFWPKVSVGDSDECWLWTGGTNPAGYGRINVNGSAQLAHRVSYKLNKGSIPDGLCVCHTCDNPLCVNPAHLWLGTRADNNRDMGKKGRARVPGLSGSDHPNAKLSTEQVRWARDSHAGGMKQAQIARALGVSKNHIGRIVHGLSRTKPEEFA